MRDIDEIIEGAQRAAAAAFRDAFTMGGAEAASELRVRVNALLEPPVSNSGPQQRQEQERWFEAAESRRSAPERPASKPSLRVLLLSTAALLTLALWHAKAARILPAFALLIGVATLLRDWSDEDGGVC